MKPMQWKQRGLVAILATSLLGLPDMASARDRYNGPYESYPNHYDDYGYPQPRVLYGNSGYYADYAGERYPYNAHYGRDYGFYQRRSPERFAAIVGGSAAAGAVVGALAGGGKGAAVGAIVGGLGGLIFDQATKHHHRY